MKHSFSCVGRAGFAFCLVLGFLLSAQAAAPTGSITGDYEVTVEAGETETWSGVVSGSGRIVKKGNGMLVLTAANTFTGGILEIPAGVTLTVRKATVGGNEVETGVYATGSLGGVVTGGGSLKVSGDSTMMVVR